MQKLIGIALMFLAFEAIAYSQSDLLNAQTNYQFSKSNLDTANSNLSNAEDKLRRAESDVQAAKKTLADYEKKLKQAEESAAIAKQNLSIANDEFKKSGITVDNIWKELNGSPKPAKQ